jgi:YD repeat-containing protein
MADGYSARQAGQRRREATTPPMSGGAGVPPAPLTTEFVHDADGRQTVEIRPDTTRVTSTYDDVNRMIGKRFPDGTRFTYTYDAAGNRTLMHNPSGRYTFTYDAANRLTGRDDPTSKDTTLGYDDDNRLTTRTVVGVGTFTYTYDKVGRPTGIVSPDSDRTTLTYDDDGRETKREFSNSMTLDTDYNNAGWMDKKTYKDPGGSVLDSYDYTHDDVGNRLAGVVLPSSERYTFTYNPAGLLGRQVPQPNLAIPALAPRRGSRMTDYRHG